MSCFAVKDSLTLWEERNGKHGMKLIVRENETHAVTGDTAASEEQ